MSLEVGELRRIGDTLIGSASVGAVLRIPNTPPQVALVVAERLTQEVIATLQETADMTGLDYDFFEGWKSKTQVPGFAIFRLCDDRTSHVLTIRYRSFNLADTEGIPERFFTGPEPVRPAYFYEVDVPVFSPLEPDVFNPKNPTGKVAKLLENLSAREGLLSRVLMPADFYSFRGRARYAKTFPGEIRDELKNPNTFTLDSHRGRYLVVVTGKSSKRGRHIKFDFSHFRGISGEAPHEGVRMTGSHWLESNGTVGVLTRDILAIYGKGLTPIYTAKRR